MSSTLSPEQGIYVRVDQQVSHTVPNIPVLADDLPEWPVRSILAKNDDIQLRVVSIFVKHVC